MDSDYSLDLAEVRRHLWETQVIGLFFPFMRRTLLLDTRTSADDGPLVIITPMVRNMKERLRSLQKLRPRFAKPESMALIAWPRLVGALQRLGVWDLIEERMVGLGGEVLRDRCQAAFLELEKQERALVRQAITGQGYDTLWQRE
jgi:hypothetical protein